MSKFTDIFIDRPVLATVVSLIILLLGLQAYFSIQVREFPLMKNTVITVTTAYPGASQDVIQGFITTPIQTAMASTEGLDYLSSNSTPGLSTIQAYIKLNYDPNAALAEVMSKVATTSNQLPKEAQQPVITKETGSTVALFYLGFFSDQMSAEEITEYLSRVVQPLFETVPGVSEVDILGEKKFAMRVWLDPEKMAARKLTPTHVINSLKSNNYQAGAGEVKSYFTVTSINAKTTLESVAEFEDLVLKHDGATIIKLKDVAKVSLGAENYNSSVTVAGKPAVALALKQTPDANPLTVVAQIKTMLPEMKKQMSEGLNYDVLLDQSIFIQDSIDDVEFTIFLTAGIVILVIFLFMGNLRAVAIPVVTIPLSLVGVVFFMEALDFSLNLLTLLAMVLAIGLVVDDAIVVVENVQRHIDQGKSPHQAAILGAREIAGPVIVMTITLAAVYAPIGFIGGLSGALFEEFAFTLAGSVIVSGIIALTLSPMMSAHILKGGTKPKMEQWVEKIFAKVTHFYQGLLDQVLANRPMILMMAVVILVSIPILFKFTAQELAPQEDKGSVFANGIAPQYANLDYTEKFTQSALEIMKSIPEGELNFAVAGYNDVNSSFLALNLVPWKKRKRSQLQIMRELQFELLKVPGMKLFTYGLPPLPGNNDGLPVQLVVTSQADSYELLFDVTEKIREASVKSGLFTYIDNGLKFDKAQIELSVNARKAGQLGVSMSEIGQALAAAFGDNYINYFSMQGRSYEVIPQVPRKFRLDTDQINNIYINARSNPEAAYNKNAEETSLTNLIPLKNVVELKQVVKPNSLTQFNQLNSSTLSMMIGPGVALGEAINFLEAQVQKFLPKGFAHDYTGLSRQFVEQGSALMDAFLFAIILIYLVLAAKFESWRDPLVVMLSVPMAISGALIFMNLGFTSINIYSQVGLVTLIGLISKHGILMVEFANQVQDEEGLDKLAAIRKAAVIRLRPVLMTTFAIVIAMIPLLLATGAGAGSHFSMGLVIFTGMSIGTCFTLLVVPVMYTYLSKHSTKRISKVLS